MMTSSTADTVTLDRLEYASLLRDRVLAEKVRGMKRGTRLVHAYGGTWDFYQFPNDGFPYFGVPTPEKALGIKEVQNGE